ncbi:MAG TPA: serine hydroxymethyltransferase [Acidimicrobiia bacterium]|jgi:glycine hydroxymethyltransferase|nr:serine hydroxymethyltransferase [Acidimicrobiia bacterium]
MISMDPIEQVDPAIAGLIRKDLERQNTHIHLIASENFASPAVMAASGSVFTNKYAEGYPGRRYYEGCQVVDEMEQLAIDRAKELFGAEYANVQPHSGAQANMGAYFSLIAPGDTVLGMRLDHGGHLTHGSPVNFSGLYYNFVAYGVDPVSEVIDMDEVFSLAKEHRPKILLAGYSAYSRILDFRRFREIADEVGAVFMVDAAHFIGLVAGQSHPSPVPYADIVTATTHKALRGPRGGLVLATERFGENLNKGVFPNVQGGPIESQIAAKAVCFHEAMQPSFREYTDQIVANANAMATRTQEEGVRVVSGGTENHLYLIDLRSVDEDLTGKDAARLLDEIGITLNFNTIPNDPRPPYRASGLRIGTPAMTTQGMKEEQAVEVASLICQALRSRGDEKTLAGLAGRVSELAAQFTPYPADFAGHV